MKKRIPVLGFMALLAATAAYAAKIVPAYDAPSLPVEQDEIALWERASSHENRLRNAGTVFHDRHMEQYIESLADRMIGDSHRSPRLDDRLRARRGTHAERMGISLWHDRPAHGPAGTHGQ